MPMILEFLRVFNFMVDSLAILVRAKKFTLFFFKNNFLSKKEPYGKMNHIFHRKSILSKKAYLVYNIQILFNINIKPPMDKATFSTDLSRSLMKPSLYAVHTLSVMLLAFETIMFTLNDFNLTTTCSTTTTGTLM